MSVNPAPADPRRNLWPFAALSAGYFAHIGFFNPYLPLWLQEMGYSLWAIGLLTSLQSATRLFAPYLWGWVSDHTGHRVRWLRFCAMAALVFSAGLWGDWGPVGLFVVLLLMFTHTSGMMPLSETVLSHSMGAAGAFDARRYGRVRLWGSAGFLVTVLLAGAWFEGHGLSSFPVWTTATLLWVGVSVWFVPEVVDRASHGQPLLPIGRVLRQPVVGWFFVSIFLHVLAHVFVYIYFSLYLDGLGYPKTVIGTLWAAAVLVEILWFFTQGRWLPRLSLPQWLLLASVLMALRMAATAAGGAWLWVLVLAQVVHAITFAAHHAACTAFISAHFPGPMRARGQALYSLIGYGVSGVTAGVLGGWISAQWGLRAVFVGAGVVALLAVGAALQVVRRDTGGPAAPGPVRATEVPGGAAG